MRAKIENLSLEEIYEDYCVMKAMVEKYYYGGTDKIKNASEALMDVLKNEIVIRTLKELETFRNDKAIREATEQINKDIINNNFKFKPFTSTTDFVNEFQNYTTSYRCGDVESDVQG